MFKRDPPIGGHAKADSTKGTYAPIVDTDNILSRTAAFLLLRDSKSSYAIENEHPPQDRIQRWARAIGEAGRNPTDFDELARLQEIAIGDARFVHIGPRIEGGFVGEHDRVTRTKDGNVDVRNDTADFYRFFDATPHAEFLYSCVQRTIEVDLPDEANFLESYDQFCTGLNAVFEMPNRTKDLSAVGSSCAKPTTIQV